MNIYIIFFAYMKEKKIDFEYPLLINQVSHRENNELKGRSCECPT